MSYCDYKYIMFISYTFALILIVYSEKANFENLKGSYE